MRTPFGHLLLTRFNVRIGYAGNVAPGVEWLQHRFALFERFCLPSMQGQTNQQFRWLVLFDAHTPACFRERIAGYARWDRFIPYFLQSFGDFHASKDAWARAHLDPRATHLITTRLDNDDALAVDFVAAVQREFRGQTREFVNCPLGYVLRSDRLYLARHASNPFVSLIEARAGAMTVWTGVDHNQLASIAPIRQIDGPPRWLRVVHEHNVEPRAIMPRSRVPLASLRDAFALADPPDERGTPDAPRPWETIGLAVAAVVVDAHDRCRRAARRLSRVLRRVREVVGGLSHARSSRR